MIVFNMNYLDSIDDPELYNKITTYIYTSDNTSKQTEVDRFRDINGEVLKYLNIDGENEIHDVAVASGQTSYELYQLLRRNDVKFNLSISDKFTKYYIAGKNIVRIYDVNGTFVCGYLFCILADNNYYINKMFVLTRMLGALLADRKTATSKSRQVSLYTRHINDLINSKFIQDINYDIFETRIHDRFTFVRCMNILNLNYFPEEKLYSAIENIALSLKENGILQIGRTVSAINNVSFYRKQNGIFYHLCDKNTGTEIKTIINEYNAKQLAGDSIS